MDQSALSERLGGVNPPPLDASFLTEDPRRRQDRSQLKLLAIFHFVLGAFMLLSIGFLFAHYFIMQTVFRNPEMMKTQGNVPFSPNDVLRIMMVFYVIGGVFCILGSALNVVSGLLLLRRKYRVFSIVIAALDCLMIPLGTALGVFTIVVLSRESVAEAYREAESKGG